MCEGQAPCLLISLFGEGWRFARDASACALCSQALCGSSSSSDDVASHREINATLLNSMSKHIRSCHVGPCVGLSPRSPRRGPAVRAARSRLDNVFDSVQRALVVSGARSAASSLECGVPQEAEKTVMENLKISAPLLSRFDIIFILLDKPDQARSSEPRSICGSCDVWFGLFMICLLLSCCPSTC